MQTTAQNVLFVIALFIAASWQRPSLCAEDSTSPAKKAERDKVDAESTAESLRILRTFHTQPAILHGGRLALGYGVHLDVKDPNDLYFSSRQTGRTDGGPGNFSVMVMPDGAIVCFNGELLSEKTIVVHRVGSALVVIDFRKSLMTWLTLK